VRVLAVLAADVGLAVVVVFSPRRNGWRRLTVVMVLSAIGDGRRVVLVVSIGCLRRADRRRRNDDRRWPLVLIASVLSATGNVFRRRRNDDRRWPLVLIASVLSLNASIGCLRRTDRRRHGDRLGGWGRQLRVLIGQPGECGPCKRETEQARKREDHQNSAEGAP